MYQLFLFCFYFRWGHWKWSSKRDEAKYKKEKSKTEVFAAKILNWNIAYCILHVVFYKEEVAMQFSSSSLEGSIIYHFGCFLKFIIVHSLHPPFFCLPELSSKTFFVRLHFTVEKHWRKMAKKLLSHNELLPKLAKKRRDVLQKRLQMRIYKNETGQLCCMTSNHGSLYWKMLISQLGSITHKSTIWDSSLSFRLLLCNIKKWKGIALFVMLNGQTKMIVTKFIVFYIFHTFFYNVNVSL